MILIEKRNLLKILRHTKIKFLFIGLLIGMIPFIILGYWWSYKINVVELQEKNLKLRKLIEEMKTHYFPPKPPPTKKEKKSE